MYQVTYDSGLTQLKRLIPHFEYVTRIAPDLYIIATLGGLKVKDRKVMDGYKAKVKAIKAALAKDYPEEWFTDQSPMFDAIETGVLDLTAHMGAMYKYNCTVEPVV